jgi:DNA invertase Pin-like site-specific DNA recombinase
VTKIGYARVSARDQHLEAQTDELTAAGCARIFADRASGKLERRPELDKALDYLRPGDQLVITKLDRLGRSTRHLLDLSEQLRTQGIDLQVLNIGIDTRTAAGRLFFTILGAFAEFERELISERTLDGLEAARARGRNGGRRPKLTAAQLAEARRLYDGKQHTMEHIAGLFRVSRSTLYRHLERAS